MAVTYFNDRAETLHNLKEDFFKIVSLLIERCESSESDQCIEIMDNCELFRLKILTLWDEFLLLSLVDEPALDKEILDGEKMVLESADPPVVTDK